MIILLPAFYASFTKSVYWELHPLRMALERMFTTLSLAFPRPHGRGFRPESQGLRGLKSRARGRMKKIFSKA